MRLRNIVLASIVALAATAAGCSFNPDLEGIGCGADGLCPDGFLCQLDTNVCIRASGGGGACDFATDCDDGNACTSDECSGGTCSNVGICPDNDLDCRVQSVEAACASEFIDITGTGTRIIEDVDEGSATVTLGSTFDFYGTSVTQVAVSTNGYLSANLADTGDFTPVCPIDDVAGRILVYHADLVGPVYHQSFQVCPRDNDATGGLGCDIILWDSRLFASGVSARMEAVLYHGTDDVAFIYASEFIGQGSGSVGIAGSAGLLQLGCGGEAAAIGGTAHCIYNAEQCEQGPAQCTRLSHAVSQNIEQGVGISCTDTATSVRRANRYMRVYDLSRLGTGAFTVSGVEVGIDGATSGNGSPQAATLTLYTTTQNPPTLASLTTLVSTGFQIADSDSQTIKLVPISTTVPGNSILVVEWSVPDGVAGNHMLYPAANRNGQTDDTYFVAPDCAFPQPTTWASIGFPTESLILNVVGTGNGPICQ